MKTKLFLSVIFLISWFCSQAHDFVKDGLQYRILNKNQVEVSGLPLDLESNPENKEKIIVPESVSYDNTDYVVTGIGERALCWIKGYKSVELPGSITYIEREAFCGSRFENVLLPANLISIGEGAFFDSFITSVSIPKSVKFLGKNVFRGCFALSNVTFSSESTFTTIPVGCFYDCENIDEIKLPSSVEEIQSEAFKGCKKLQKIYSYGFIDFIGPDCFSYCSSLKYVNLNMLGSIENGAFSYCNNLRHITFNTNDIGYNVFNGSNLHIVVFQRRCPNRSPESILGDSWQAERTVLVLPKDISEDYIKSFPDMLQKRTCVTLESDIVDHFSVACQSYTVDQYVETPIIPNYPEDYYEVGTDYVLFPAKRASLYFAWKTENTDFEASLNSVIVPEKDIQTVELPDNEQMNMFLTPQISSNTTVYVGSKGTGVENTTLEKSENFDLYDINGSVVYRNLDENSLKNLPKGMYIKKSSTGTSKIIL